MKLSIVIVSYRSRELTRRCLTYLATVLPPAIEHEVILVDNASADGTREMVIDSFPHVVLIEAASNLGFGAGNNLGIARARGDCVMLLNTDAFPHPGCIETLLECIESHSRVAVVGPQLLDVNQQLTASTWSPPNPLLPWPIALGLHRLLRRDPWHPCHRRDVPTSVEFVSGASLLARRDALVEVGGFDEDFFMYFEEVDLQRRLCRRGWQILYVPAAKCIHEEGGSTPSESKRGWYRESELRYVRKHFGAAGEAVYRAGWWTHRMRNRAIRRLRRGQSA